MLLLSWNFPAEKKLMAACVQPRRFSDNFCLSLAAGRQLSFNFEIVVKTVCLQPQTWRNWDNYICIYLFHVRNNLFSRFYPEWLLNINIITLKAVVRDFRYQTKKRNAQHCGNYFAIFLELKWEKCVQLTYYSQCDDITRLCPGGVSCT